MARRCFYSFHYKPDSFRVSQVRNIGAIEDNKPASDNDWEEVIGKGDGAIKKWIAGQLKGRSCTIVLVGENTAKRKWVDHEIVTSWEKQMGVVGIHINGLKNSDGKTSSKGANPFSHLTLGKDKTKLSNIVKCYTPSGANSKEKYAWISKNLEEIVEEAIKIRNNN